MASMGWCAHNTSVHSNHMTPAQPKMQVQNAQHHRVMESRPCEWQAGTTGWLLFRHGSCHWAKPAVAQAARLHTIVNIASGATCHSLHSISASPTPGRPTPQHMPFAHTDTTAAVLRATAALSWKADSRPVQVPRTSSSQFLGDARPATSQASITHLSQNKNPGCVHCTAQRCSGITPGAGSAPRRPFRPGPPPPRCPVRFPEPPQWRHQPCRCR